MPVGAGFWPHVFKSLSLLMVVAVGFLFIVASGGGGGTATTGTTTTADLSAYTMPTEISAVPVDTSAGDTSATLNRSLVSADLSGGDVSSNLTRSFSSNIRAIARAATDAGTDYSNAETRKYVEEHALEQFSILETVLNALSQTNYTDEIDNGPYKAMVAFQDEENGTNKKSLEAWVCQADTMEDGNGDSYLRARAWIEEQDFKDPDTGQLMSRELLDQELSKIEKPAGIANPKDFRYEVVKFSLRARAKNGGKNPSWTSYEKIRDVIERRMFSQVEDLLPVISFGAKKDGDTEKKQEEFVQRMIDRGYTARQVRRLVEWYMRVKKSS